MPATARRAGIGLAQQATMLVSLAALLVCDLVLLGALIWLTVAAFRVRVWWGLATFVPFGSLVFTIAHWREARAPFLTAVICGGIMGGIIGAQPELLAKLQQNAAMIKSHGAPGPAPSVPHEAHDLAETQAAAPAAPTVDPNAAPRAAYAKHHADLTALYRQLDAERTALKPGQPAAAFNAKAARYQDALKALAAEKTRLDALDAAAAPATARAPGGGQDAGAAALDRLQLLASTGDYPGFGELLKKCLTDDRRSPSFPRIVALGRQTLPNATPDKLSILVRHQTDAAHAEMDTVTRQIQLIVNQTPPTVPKPPHGSRTIISGFHPGATKPDFNTADLWKTRQPYDADFLCMEGAESVYYRAADCEFNPQTKYFITTRNVPKKKLTEAEYTELTRLYRLLGRDEKLVAAQAQRLADVGRASGELLALNTQLASLPPQ